MQVFGIMTWFNGNLVKFLSLMEFSCNISLTANTIFSSWFSEWFGLYHSRSKLCYQSRRFMCMGFL